jgi:hypothetical protein
MFVDTLAMAKRPPEVGIGRSQLLRRGELLEAATVAWNAIEGIIAVAAGILASSVALIGFGVDSFVETASGAIVGWRLHAELSGHADEDRAEVLERRAGRIAGGLLLGLAVYIIIDAGRRLLGFGGGSSGKRSRDRAHLDLRRWHAAPGMGEAAHCCRTPQRRAAGRCLRDDCMFLAVADHVDRADPQRSTLGWWWADPLAALAIVPLAIREGLEGWRGERDDSG